MVSYLYKATENHLSILSPALSLEAPYASTIPACRCLLLAGGPGLALQLLLPCPSRAWGSTAQQGTGCLAHIPSQPRTPAPVDPSAGDDCSPWGSMPANAAHTDAIEAVALRETGNWFPWFCPRLFPVFLLVPCLGQHLFLNHVFSSCLFWFCTLKRFINHHCLTDIPNSRF